MPLRNFLSAPTPSVSKSVSAAFILSAAAFLSGCGKGKLTEVEVTSSGVAEALCDAALEIKQEEAITPQAGQAEFDLCNQTIQEIIVGPPEKAPILPVACSDQKFDCSRTIGGLVINNGEPSLKGTVLNWTLHCDSPDSQFQGLDNPENPAVCTTHTYDPQIALTAVNFAPFQDGKDNW